MSNDRWKKLLHEALDLFIFIVEVEHVDVVTPCEHEPNELVGTVNAGYILITPKTLSDAYKCKHCGVKIKAEKWVVV